LYKMTLDYKTLGLKCGIEIHLHGLLRKGWRQEKFLSGIFVPNFCIAKIRETCAIFAPFSRSIAIINKLRDSINENGP